MSLGHLRGCVQAAPFVSSVVGAKRVTLGRGSGRGAARREQEESKTAMERTLTELMTREVVALSSGREVVVRCEALVTTTRDAPEFIDITEDVERIVAESGVRFGLVTVFSTHTTAAIKVNENEPLLLQDMTR